ncbi:MAG: alpha/beta hydrolase [Ruminococcaceae bacterium]|nr:alpha/beta hydrolase [Oscillospiraceae bacterium]MBR3598084.1 alpha/beta hydrolase [Clostridia bacterium]
MSTKKTLLKATAGTAVGTGVLVGAVSALAYELILNIKFASKIGEMFSPKPIPMSEEDYEAAKNDLPDTSVFQEKVSAWHSCHTAEDIYITGKDGKKRHAKFFDNGHPEKWAIIFHGYTSGPEGMYHYAYTYAEMGFNCILPSMIGHSKDVNKYCSMGYHDRYMGIDWIKYILLLNPDADIVLHGESMGAATTMMITGEKLPSNVKAAVSDCGFTSVYNEYIHVARHQMSPAMVPLIPVVSKYSELRGNFNFKKCAPVQAVKYSETPTLFVHGEADDFVPFYMLQEVYDACAAEKEIFTVRGAEHAESSTVNPKLYWTNVYNFLKKHVAL